MRDVPAELAAALATRYRLERELGAGGMATVFLARDLKHERDVAIKVLRADVAAAVGVDRFLSEIRTTGNLKHPHILPLFDSGLADAVPFYVMPFIDGESLRARLRQVGRLPIGEVVRILHQLADALAHAHAKGVIHRDIKADNVLVSDRHVFLADFGVARALVAPSGETVAGTSAVGNMTGTGMMVGTPGYMAPEQIVAGPVDHRTDIYAFGALATSCSPGRLRLPARRKRLSPLNSHGRQNPIARQRADTPPPLASLVMRCLQKDPGDRWQRTDDLLAVLESVPPTPLRGYGETGPPAPIQGFREASSAKRRLAYLALAFLVVAALAAGWYAVRAMRAAPSLAIGRITRVTSEPGLELDPALSPDGQTIAYAAGATGRMRIYVRPLTGGRIVPLMDESFAEGQRWPQWSPDGSRIVFQAGRPPLSSRVATSGGMLYQTSALGGPPRKLFSSFPDGLAISPTWSPDGTRIAFGGSGGLYVASADGDGVPRVIATGSELHSPRWSPDGDKVAYVRGGSIFTFGEESLGNVSTSTLAVVTPRQRARDVDYGWRLARYEPGLDAGQPDAAIHLQPRRRA